MTGQQSRVANIQIDFGAMRKLVELGIRRASAFIRFGLDGIDARDGGDFNLSARVQYRFWPEQISVASRDAAREEYRAWLTGSCLRELDLFYGLFLDRVWWAIEVGEKHGTSVEANHILGGKFHSDTNVAKKHRCVSQKLGTDAYFEQLNSLSLARNALTHHAGLVRKRDCNNAAQDRLEIKWLGLEMIARRDGMEVVVEQLPFEMQDHFPGEGDVEILYRFPERELVVAEGQAIILTHAHVAELCMFYNIMAGKVLDGLKEVLRARMAAHDARAARPAPPDA